MTSRNLASGLAAAAAVLLLGCPPRLETEFPQRGYRINIGGRDYVDRAGRVWSGEQLYRPGFWGIWNEQQSAAATTDAIIAGTRDLPIYQTIRYGKEIRLKFDNVPQGSYLVHLHFCDIVSREDAKATAMRIELEGKVVVPSFALLEVTRPNCALVRYFDVAVADGQLNVDLVDLTQPPKEGAKLAAIEVLPQ